jgi:transcriptional regulator with XRE-family HTH domain
LSSGRRYHIDDWYPKVPIDGGGLNREKQKKQHVRRGTIMLKARPDPTDLHVGKIVRMRRLMLGMSQKKLGQALGLTFQQIQKYEKGTNRISASRLQQMAAVLQISVPFFFEGLENGCELAGASPKPTYVADFLATADGLTLTKAFMRIKDPKLRGAIANLVKELAGEES